MKKFILFHLLIWLSSTSLMAQDEIGVQIGVVPPTADEMPAEAAKHLTTKLNSLLTNEGMADSGLNPRFILTAKVNVTQKDVTQTTPARISQKIDVTFLIGDVLDKKLYESYTMSLSGIGVSETKSFISALNGIKPANPNLKEFVKKAKQEIVEYFNANGASIIRSARSLSSGGKHDEALYNLCLIPTVCNSYAEAQKAIGEIYVKKVNEEGSIMLAKAQAEWQNGRNGESAQNALNIIAAIPPTATCYNQAQKLTKEIDSVLKENEKKEWELKKEEMELKHKENITTINAARDAAVAYAKNQPKYIYRTIVHWW